MKISVPQRRPSTALFAAALALLAGCDTTTKLGVPATAAPVETRSPLGQPTAAAVTPAMASAAPQSKVASVDLAAGGVGTSVAGASATGAAATAATSMMAMPTQRIVYFDFDSYTVKDEFQPIVDGYAKVLAANRSRQLVIEGHTDDRGGHEYNLALGQKRAEAVVRSLTLLGASGKQLEAVSFGEERPAVQGSGEAVWAKNRRAELKDR